MHRVRFFDYMPSGIRAIAFNRQTERIAVARVDGSVEIFTILYNLFQEKVRSYMSCTVCLVVHVNASRLFNSILMSGN